MSTRHQSHAPAEPVLHKALPPTLEAMMLECQISALNHARACATGEADATTIYGRIDSLIYTAQERLQVLGQGGAR